MIDPIELLSRQVPAFSIGAETRSLHLARIHASLVGPVTAPPASLFDLRPLTTSIVDRFRSFDWRQKLTAGVVAFMVAIPSAAVATEGSQPDTWLYPVKLAVEPIWLLVDDEIVAEHRVEELQLALREDLPTDALLTRADRAVARLDPDSIWRDELALIERTLKEQADDVEMGTDTESEAVIDSPVVDESSGAENSRNIEETTEPTGDANHPPESSEISDPDDNGSGSHDSDHDSDDSDDSDHDSDDESHSSGDSHDDDYEGGS
ncbi:MAG: hypothetical protein JJE47_14065 [Acidimicrobiia bacterium]|nr:hypothetical protein [Acidimicrobiia bacterium]